MGSAHQVRVLTVNYVWELCHSGTAGEVPWGLPHLPVERHAPVVERPARSADPDLARAQRADCIVPTRMRHATRSMHRATCNSCERQRVNEESAVDQTRAVPSKLPSERRLKQIDPALSAQRQRPAAQVYEREALGGRMERVACSLQFSEVLGTAVVCSSIVTRPAGMTPISMSKNTRTCQLG